MKTLITLLAFSFVLQSCSAQGPQAMLLGEKPSLEVEQQLVKYEKQTQSALTMTVNAPSDDVNKGVKVFLEEKYQLEVKKMKGGMMAEQASLADISDNKLDVYLLIKEDEKGTRLDLLAKKNGSFLNENDNPAETTALRGMLKRFARDFYVGHYEEVIGEERKTSSKLQKEYDKTLSEGEKLKKAGDGFTSDVSKAEEEITSIDQKIAELEKKKEGLRADIKAAKSSIDKNKSDQASNQKIQAEKKKVLDTQLQLIEKLKGHSESFK